METMFKEIVLHNYFRSVKERARSRKVVGPYHWRPSKPGTGQGFYWNGDSDTSGRGCNFRLRVDLRGRSFVFNEFGDSYTGLVYRLPRGRGFMAGATMGEGMASFIDPDIFEDEDEAAYAASEAARIAAERQEEFEQEQNEDDEA